MHKTILPALFCALLMASCSDSPSVLSESKTPPSSSITDESASELSTVEVDKASQARIDSFMTVHTASGLFAGVVGVYTGFDEDFVKAYGQRNSEKDLPFERQTRVNIASLDKLFTTVAILRLVQEEKLDLEQKVKDILPELSDPRSDEVTLLNLLNHTSGYGMYWDDPYFQENMEELTSIPAYMAFLKDAPIAFEPGSEQQYSNTGFVLLGAVIEKVTDGTYFDYIESLILDPLGMKDTGYRIDFQDDRLATGYMRDPQDPEAPLQPADPFTPIMGNSAGGGYSTLDDLYRFVKAFYAGELLDREGMVLTTTHFERSVGEMKGLLLGGGAPGANSIIDYDIDADLLIIVLSNYDPPGAEEAARTIRGLILKP